jgi:hypothetical protein
MGLIGIVAVKPEVREGLKAWADSEQRTLSSLCAYLPKPTKNTNASKERSRLCSI